MNLSIGYFWGQMTANPLLMTAVILTLGVILVNGWTDAPNAIADQTKDILEIIGWREILDKMEKCADACEHVGDTIEVVVMKNT